MKKSLIIILGTAGNDPYAGMAWMHMQIMLGLQRLGHDVYYFEISESWPYDPILQSRTDQLDYTLSYLSNLMSFFGVQDRWAFRKSFSPQKEWYGMNASKAIKLLTDADMVLNITGSTFLPPDITFPGRHVLYGTDPGYNEVKYLQGDVDVHQMVETFTDVVTYAENIGNEGCMISGLHKLKAKTRQPVLLDFWQNDVPIRDVFTTVGNFRQDGRDVTINGKVLHWSKHYAFMDILDLPLHTSQTLEFATNLKRENEKNTESNEEIPSMGFKTDEYNLLLQRGWKLIDGPALSQDFSRYRDYIQASKAEFTVAKNQYAHLKTGWFSERSACYLAAGKPVITQDTSFGCALPIGKGLFAYNTMDDILTAIDAINTDYKGNCAAALEIAHEYFEAKKVLSKLLDDLNN